MSTLDPVTLEVIRNALPAVANEMATDLQRTSYNMMIYEVRDFCTALIQEHGTTTVLFAQDALTVAPSGELIITVGAA